MIKWTINAESFETAEKEVRIFNEWGHLASFITANRIQIILDAVSDSYRGEDDLYIEVLPADENSYMVWNAAPSTNFEREIFLFLEELCI